MSNRSQKRWVYPYPALRRKVSGYDIENILAYWSLVFHPEAKMMKNLTPKRERAIAKALYYSTPETIGEIISYASRFTVFEKKDISSLLEEEVFLSLKAEMEAEKKIEEAQEARQLVAQEAADSSYSYDIELD
jgi:hypothetical protein